MLALLWGVVIALPELTLAAVIGVGGYGVASGTLTLGTVIAAVTIMTYLRFPIDAMGWLLTETGNAATATVRYWEVRNAPLTVAESHRPKPLARPVRGQLRLDGVRLRYPGAAAEVLQGVDLAVHPGETVALG